MAKGITLQELDASALVNLVPHLGTTSNSGDAYSITTSLTIGVNQKFTIKFNAASSSAPTLRINNGTAYPVKKPNGNNAKVYASAYSLFWDGTNFILQGEGGEYGTATAGDVRSTKTFGTDDGPKSGSLITRNTSQTNITPTTSPQTLQPGIYDYPIVVNGVAAPTASRVRQYADVPAASSKIFNFASQPNITLVTTSLASVPEASMIILGSTPGINIRPSGELYTFNLYYDNYKAYLDWWAWDGSGYQISNKLGSAARIQVDGYYNL